MKKHFTLFSILFSLLFFFNTNHSNAQVQTPVYESMCSISNAYYQYLPQGYSASGSEVYPLLIFVHGEGELGDGTPANLPAVLDNGPPMQINQGIFPSSFTVNGQSFSFIVLTPQFTVWPADQTLDTVIDFAIQHYKVDLTRIYLTGLSMGGGVVWQYTGNNVTYADRIAAMVPICGASYPNPGRADIIAQGNIPVWATHNLNDPVCPVSYTEGYVANINAAPTPPNPLAMETIFNADTHDAWTATYDLGFVTENGLNIYQWMLQYQRGGNVVLPITGLSLNVTKQGNDKAILTWKTYSESYNKGFEIQRSTDGVNFDSLGFVNSHSIDGAGANYGFTDASPLSGKNYYRLEQTDINGDTKYSPVEFVDFSNSTSITLYPNPASDILHINTSRTFTNAALKIWSTNGQLAKQLSINGSGTFDVSINNLPSGMYSVEIKDADNDVKVSFIKQ